jgi:hypothetical protein
MKMERTLSLGTETFGINMFPQKREELVKKCQNYKSLKRRTGC